MAYYDKCPGFFIERTESAALLAREDDPSKMVFLSETAMYIFELCDGITSESQIVDKVFAEYDVNRQICEKDTALCIKQLLESGAIYLKEYEEGGGKG